jgi:PAS domain-containing protein
MSAEGDKPSVDMAALLDHLQEPVMLIDRAFHVVYANKAARRAYGSIFDEGGSPRCCHQLSHGLDKPCDFSGVHCPVREVFATGKPVRTLHHHTQASGEKHWEEVLATPFATKEGEGVSLVVEEVRNITENLKAKEVVRQLREQWQLASQVLPICASCKQVRQSDGSWQSIEQHLREHAQVDFTHGLCPTCTNKLYPKPDRGGL